MTSSAPPSGPPATPIGFLLNQTSKLVGRAFDQALAEAGGSLPTWLVLLSLMQGGHRAQVELAEAVGVTGPTLTHHLNGLEAQGLIVRKRDPANRRLHQVVLTDEGRATFLRLRKAAAAFDLRLREGISPEEEGVLRAVLGRLRVNARGDEAA
ncbi:MAG: winged helix-turn-helix transcriptional regulator [Caulobacter sp.]|nr:winged helix-turn-helix transcriptional regulator [Caulobacter sp.]